VRQSGRCQRLSKDSTRIAPIGTLDEPTTPSIGLARQSLDAQAAILEHSAPVAVTVVNAGFILARYRKMAPETQARITAANTVETLSRNRTP